MPIGPAVEEGGAIEWMPTVEEKSAIERMPEKSVIEGMPAIKGMPTAERMPAIEGTQIEPTIRQSTFETAIKDMPSTNSELMREGLFARACRWLLSFLR